MNRNIGFVGLAAVIGVTLRLVVNLEPAWWLAWFVPGLILALTLRTGSGVARGCVIVAAAIGVTANVPFFLKVMPPFAVAIVMALQVLQWMLIIGSARRIVLAYSSAWTILALPVIGVAVDTLLAHFTPDGNWGSLAYTQAEVLPMAQLSSVFGVGGVLFVLLLVNSAVAFAIHFGVRLRGALRVYGATLLVVGLAAGFGLWRLQAPVTGQPVTFGIASIDDFVAAQDTQKAEEVWLRYEAHVAELAAKGAKLVLLPEKISVLPTAQAEPLKARLAGQARENRVWLVVGVGVDTGTERRNEAWWFAPDGSLATNYLKHFMAPPEREFVSGDQFPVNHIDAARFGIAICKDMHFASLGRAFGVRDAGVMLVPAWDFDDDAWLAAHMTKMRGVENGYVVARAARNGLLSVSDAYGRMLAQTRSKPMPGASLVVTATVGPRVPTIYTRIGDALGWFCVAGMVVLIPLSLMQKRAARL